MWTLVVVLLVLWLLGWNFNVGNIGGLIHLLLLVAIVMTVVSLARGRPIA